MNKDLWNNIIVPVLVIVVAVGIFIGIAVVLMRDDVRVYGASPPASELSFDHSNCQYPNRTTNPPDGCDNTDPCDPTNTKGGSGDCDDVLPAIVPSVAPAPSQSVKKSNCEEN